jgi:hypothetical protein
MSELPDPHENEIADRAVEIGLLDKMMARHQDYVSSLDKWLLATFVGINGAGALAVLSAAGTGRLDARGPGLAFMLGIVAAIVSAMLERRAYSRSTSSIIASLSHSRRWERIFRTLGKSEADTFAASKGAAELRLHNRARILRRRARKAFVVSLLMFVIGSVATGVQLEPSAQKIASSAAKPDRRALIEARSSEAANVTERREATGP